MKTGRGSTGESGRPAVGELDVVCAAGAGSVLHHCHGRISSGPSRGLIKELMSKKRRKQEGKADRCHLTKMVLSISLRSRKQVAV